MKLRPLIAILPCLGLALNAWAQIPREASSLPPEQWELTLDVIKSQAQNLMIENNGLQDEYQKLKEQVGQLQEAIQSQQDKNGQMERFLKERRGRTDQQQRIDELTQAVMDKQSRAQDYEAQWAQLQRKQARMDQNIRQLKNTISEVDLQQQAEQGKIQASPPDDAQLVELRKQLDEESKKEVILENEIRPLKEGTAPQDDALAAASARLYDRLKSTNRSLRRRLRFTSPAWSSYGRIHWGRYLGP